MARALAHVVTVQVERILSWPEPACTGEPTVTGTQPPAGDPLAQAAPKNGTGPRVDAARAATRLRRLPHVLLGYVGADGFPMVVPVAVGAVGAQGIDLSGPLPTGGRRAGVMGHRYEAKLIGLETRQHTGWLQDRVYAPQTESGFRAQWVQEGCNLQSPLVGEERAALVRSAALLAAIHRP